MTAFKRVFSGSVAGWARISIAIASQIALVPLFLSHWTVEAYGYWLLIQTISGLTTCLSVGHQNYVGYELLKCNPDDSNQLARIFYSSLPYALIIAFVELLIVALLVLIGISIKSYYQESAAADFQTLEAAHSLLLQSTAWIVLSSISGVAGRLLGSLGRYPRSAWWGVVAILGNTIATILAVIQGLGIWGVTIAIIASNALYNIPLFFDYRKIILENKILPQKPDWKLGATNAKKSLVLALNLSLDTFRQQGIRILLSISPGVKEMTAFATMRTFANIALQSFNSISGPIMPELMKQIRAKDQDRIDLILTAIWAFTAIILGPMLVILQVAAPTIFEAWTKQRIEFNPYIFALLSIGLISFAFAQSANSILQGNNRIRDQFRVTTTATIITISGVAVVAPNFGIVGAALVLCATELVALAMLTTLAKKWLIENSLNWPNRLFRDSLGIGLLSVFSIVAIAANGAYSKDLIIAYILIQMIASSIYFHRLPLPIKLHVKKLIKLKSWK